MADDIIPLRRAYRKGEEPPCEACTFCAARAEIERLRSEVESQTFWAELLAGNNCWCVADDVGVCAPCAYRQTMRQNEEARRG